MPTYDYACAACGHRFEVVHGVHGHGPDACPNCGGGPVRKAIVRPTVVFKGSGWAKVDRRPARSQSKAKDSSDDAPKPKDAPDDVSKPKQPTAEPAAPSTTDSGSAPTTTTSD
jgi:putative FmdB family regulatory protein